MLKRIRLAFGVAVLTVAMLVASAAPALAQPTNFFQLTEVFGQPVAPVSLDCTDTEDPIELTECTPGADIPEGQVCDIPVDFTFEGVLVGSGFQCRVPEAPPGDGGGSGTGGGGGGAAPITQEGDQESEAGEIDQSFDVS